MSKITLTALPFVSAPTGNQTVKVSYRNFSDPDVIGSYTAAPDATVAPDGSIISPIPYTKTTPYYKTVVKATNNCGGNTVNQLFIFCGDITGMGGSLAPPPATVRVYYGAGTVPTTESAITSTSTYIDVAPNANYTLNFSSFSSSDYKWFSPPSTENAKTSVNDTHYTDSVGTPGGPETWIKATSPIGSRIMYNTQAPITAPDPLTFS